MEESQHTAEIARQLQAQLQVTQTRIEKNARGIENRIQSKLHEQHTQVQQRTELKLSQLERQWNDVEPQITKKAGTVVNEKWERHGTSMEERLQQRLLEAQKQQLAEMVAETKTAHAVMSLRIENAVTEAAGLQTRQERFETKLHHTMQQTKQEVHEHLASIMLGLEKRNKSWYTAPGATMVSPSPNIVASEVCGPHRTTISSKDNRELNPPEQVERPSIMAKTFLQTPQNCHEISESVHLGSTSEPS